MVAEDRLASGVYIYIIYRELAKRRNLVFRQRLIESLSEPIRSSVSLVLGLVQGLHTISSASSPYATSSERKRRDCIVCSDRQGGTRHVTHYQRGTCPDNPALCVDTCFKAYHIQQRYCSRLVPFICYNVPLPRVSSSGGGGSFPPPPHKRKGKEKRERGKACFWYYDIPDHIKTCLISD